MEWITRLSGKTIGLDTAPLIYFMEEHPFYLEFVHPFFQALDRGDFIVVTSTITLLEVLVYPNMTTPWHLNTGIFFLGPTW